MNYLPTFLFLAEISKYRIWYLKRKCTSGITFCQLRHDDEDNELAMSELGIIKNKCAHQTIAKVHSSCSARNTMIFWAKRVKEVQVHTFPWVLSLTDCCLPPGYASMRSSTAEFGHIHRAFAAWTSKLLTSQKFASSKHPNITSYKTSGIHTLFHNFKLIMEFWNF